MRKLKIIVFDDDAVFLKMLEKCLSAMNYEVQCFNQAITCPVCENICDNTCADIIISDFDMPQLNGVELLNQQTQRGCPINIENKAIMSGVLSGDMKGLVYTFFQKPISVSEVDIWIKERLSSIDLSAPLNRTYLDC
jgi:DNA-binding NtrC family response regulator